MESKHKGSLFAKILSGYVIAILSIVILTFIIIHSSRSFSENAEIVDKVILPNTLKAKDLQIHVIQVQQWLTDISATRGAPGYDDGFDEAKQHAEAFTSIVNEFKEFYQNQNDDSKVASLESMQKAFDGYYAMGQEMAQTYIDYGPAEGNKIMEKFDPYAEEIDELVTAFVDNMSLMLVNNIDEVSEDSKNLVKRTKVISVIDIIILLVLGILISRGIVKPIRRVVAILKDISEGEGDLTKSIEEKSTDEIGLMARYFNETFAKIRNLVSIVQTQSHNLGVCGSNLGSNMTETAAAINQISANIKSIQNQTVNQSASVSETSATMEQISAGIDKLNSLIKEQSASINDSSSEIGKLIRHIEESTETLTKNNENIEHLTENSELGKVALQQITGAIEEVQVESQGLREISAVIQSIAEETNLLAMNAAIEAAHAGESGKGFAVVAAEVRKLAESSTKQTKTIEAALQKITASIEDVTKYAQDVVEKFRLIEKGVSTVSKQESTILKTMEDQTNNSRKVMDSINIINDITKKVQQSSVEMLEGSRQISKEAQNMNIITQEINGGMTEMATGADQITEAVATVNGLTEETKNSIDSLTTEVHKFKV
ncbi:MAG: HAMP domain-containing protein [Treponema sp.]|nr:HAMP domain-containing protein [Treponema sp.]